MQTIRSFIALELSEEIQEALGRIQASLKKSNADVKWVKPRGIHLTLRFLGNISPQLIAEINKLIDRLAQSHSPFKLSMAGLGAFPNIEHPRVIWVGIEQGRKESERLARDLEQGLNQFGFLPEKRNFYAHLTLGRARSSRNRNQLKQLLSSLAVETKTMLVDKIVLFQSTLRPQGAIYQTLHQGKLGR